MMKKGISYICVGMMVLGMAVSAHAFMVWDGFRTVERTIQGIDDVTKTLKEHKKTIAKKEENKMWSKEIDIENKLTDETYGFLKKEPLSGLASARIAPAQDSIESAREFVKKTFFLPDNGKATTPEQKAMIDKRREYISQLAQEQLTLARGLQDSVQTDMENLQKAGAKGGGVLQEIQLDTQTVLKLTMISAANVVLGVKEIELDAAELLLDKDAVLVSEVKNKK